MTEKIDLNKPDEFISITQRVLAWINKQRVVLILGAAAVALVVLSVGGPVGRGGTAHQCHQDEKGTQRNPGVHVRGSS